MNVSAIIDYFVTDPLRILYLLGGAGGVWFWLDRWTNRTRVLVRLLGHSVQGSADRPRARILFEVVNVGVAVTSLEPDVTASGYRFRRVRGPINLEVLDPDRQLPPHVPRRITAEGDAPTDYAFWFYKRFRVRLARGSSRTIRIRAAGLNVLRPWRYQGELFLYRVFGVRRFFGPSLRAVDVA